MKNKILLTILMGIIILNLFDGIFTTYWIETNKATEANPFMAELINYPIAFMVIKLTLVSLGISFLWLQRNKRFRFVLSSSILIFTIFIGILCYHIYGFINLPKLVKTQKEKQSFECVYKKNNTSDILKELYNDPSCY